MTFISVSMMLTCMMLIGLKFLLARTESVSVRLVDGYTSNQGYVEISMDNSTSRKTWTPICGDYFTETEAKVVCRQLGYRFSKREVATHYKDKKNVELKYFRCTEDQTSLSKCETNHCIGRKTFAWVCCSNDSSYGEQIEDMFVSHCQSNWTSAERVCEAINSTVAMETDYTLAKSTSGTATDGLDYEAANLTWIGKFFTPWIWSNGCFKLNLQSKMTSLSSNSPEHCLQYCGVKDASAFALQGDTCQCFPADYLPLNGSRVSPGSCPFRCPGNNDQYCGASQTGYWSLYSIESRDRFSSFSSPASPPTRQYIFSESRDRFSSFSSPASPPTRQYIFSESRDRFSTFSSPASPPTRQCAIITTVPEVRLKAESCNKSHGYTCSHFQADGPLRYPAFSNHIVPMTVARHKCVKDSILFRLAGNSVLSEKKPNQNWENNWVDIERTVVSVHRADDFGVGGRIDPEWCLALRRVNWTYSEITMRACSERLPYYCMKKHRWRPPTPTTANDDEPLVRTTGRPNDSTYPAKTNGSVVITTKDNDAGDAGTTEAIIIASTSLVLVVLAFIIGVCCCRKRCSRKGDRMRNTHHYETNTTEMDLLPGNAEYSSLQEESHYEEIPEKPDEKNVYHELQNYTPLQPETERENRVHNEPHNYLPLQQENERSANGASGSEYDTCAPFSEDGRVSSTADTQPNYDKVIVADNTDPLNCIQSSSIIETSNISQIISDKKDDNDITMTDNYTTPKDFIRSDKQNGKIDCRQQNSYIYPYDSLKSTEPASETLNNTGEHSNTDCKHMENCFPTTNTTIITNSTNDTSYKTDDHNKTHATVGNDQPGVRFDQSNDKTNVLNDEDITVTYSYSLPSDFIREQQELDKESDPYSDPYDFLKPGDSDTDCTAKQRVINTMNTSHQEQDVT